MQGNEEGDYLDEDLNKDEKEDFGGLAEDMTVAKVGNSVLAFKRKWKSDVCTFLP